MNEKKTDHEMAHSVRSRILNYAILTEMRLEDIIRDYFVNDNHKKLKFSELIVGKEFFTFEQKTRVFGKILEGMENLEIFSPFSVDYNLSKNKKELLKKIRHIREIRNAVAHIHPFRNEKIKEITIIDHKKKKEIILNEKFDMIFFDEYSKVDDALRRIHQNLLYKL